MRALEKQRAIPVERIEETCNHAFEIVQTKTKELFPDLLPNTEEVSVKIVKNQYFSANAIYLGNFKSRIEINLMNY